MTFEVRQDKHGIVIGYALAHGHFFQVEAVGHWQIYIAMLIHDIDRAECPAIDLECFAMLCRGIAVAMIKGIGFHNGTIRDFGLQGFDKIPWDDIWTVFFASMHLDGHLAVNALIYQVV